MDPMNIRYVSDTTNMQLWVMHNGARYAFVSAEGYVIVWDYEGCEFLSGHSHVVNEVRPAIGATYFLAGSRHEEQARRMAAEMVDVVAEHCGPNARIAVEVPLCRLQGVRAGRLDHREWHRTHGAGPQDQGVDEIKAMRARPTPARPPCTTCSSRCSPE